MGLIYYNEVGQHRGYRQMTQPELTERDENGLLDLGYVYKERRCGACECNLLVQQITDNIKAKVQCKWTRWFCHDCQEFVETKLVIVDWRDMGSKSTDVAKLEKRCERRMQIITEMRDATEARLLGL